MAECQDFAQFGLAPNLLSAITRMGYTQPTAIQCTAIPVVLPVSYTHLTLPTT